MKSGNTKEGARTDNQYPGGAGGGETPSSGLGYGRTETGGAEDLTRRAIDSSLSDTDDLFNALGAGEDEDPDEFFDDNVEQKSTDEEPEEVDDNNETDPSDVGEADDDDKDNQNNKPGNQSSKKGDDSQDDAEIISPFLDLLHDELGWEVDDEEKPANIGELVDYMKRIVDENAADNYASEEVAQLNEYIKNGGDIHTFYQQAYGQADVDPEKIDISDVASQRYVVAANLRLKGYTEERISRTISRFEDSGILEDEAEDAIIELRDATEQNRAALVEQQKRAVEEQRAQEVEFFRSVQEEVSKVESIRGLPITRVERDQLLRYIFQRDRDGVTQYQRDYYKNLNKNLIESAYFTMKGESLVNGVQRRAESDAARKLRERLKSKTAKGRNSQMAEGKLDASQWDWIAKQF
jgi:hypothetical protein